MRRDGVVQSCVCEACHDLHDAEVIFENGGYGHYCPDSGFVTLEPQNIQAIAPDIGKLVSELARVLGCKRRKSTAIHESTWRIGTLDSPDGAIAIYFQPTLRDEREVAQLQTALSQEIASSFVLILTAAGTLPIGGATVACLNDAFELTTSVGDFDLMTGLHTLVGAPMKTQNGRPSLYAGKLKSLILARMENDTALQGRNAEALEIERLYRFKYPSEASPSQASIRRHLTKVRSGS